MQRKRTRRHIKNIRPHHVSRHQVRRALHTLKPQPANPRQSFHRKRLREPWHAFNQRVPAANQHQQKLLDNLVLPHNDLRHLRSNMLGKTRNVFHVQDFSLAIFFFKPSCSSYFSSSCTNPSASAAGTFCARLATKARAKVVFNPVSFQPSRDCTASASAVSLMLDDTRNCLERFARNRWYTKPTTAGSACARSYNPPSVSTNSSGASRETTGGNTVGPLLRLNVKTRISPRIETCINPQATGVFCT